ncbi:helix-turn-helix domain-containing protein [Clostridium sporogenes]|uniref:helix-turn-helix domain-containing protein n=1 Tax=Clostridium sporogenes TaxID=1509 RepID=UPI0013D10F4F|nr:AraC family transcriptional regulator [Clostridium sporogenes]NFQ67432.1 helix-turn-helix transcriptional regulator [Clostridium sporogenes]UJA32825.1 AraC family transcriptional regulator [Clostridium sporogenes]
MIFTNIIDYFLKAPTDMNFILIPEHSTEFEKYYGMNPNFGEGFFRIFISKDKFLVLNADYKPNYDFEKVSEIKQDYIEISKFYTTSSSYKVGKRNIKKVDPGILCFINTDKLVHVYCKKNQPIKFTKIILLREYFNEFLKGRYGSYKDFKTAFKYLARNPSSPELNFIFNQIRNSKVKSMPQMIYMESKILEILSNVTHDHAEKWEKEHISVRLTKTDKKLLIKCEKYLRDNIGKYTTLNELSNIAKMSTSRFLLAFRQYFGTTPYQYLKNLRMNAALTLLLNTEENISSIAKELGYKNSGHFSGIFKSYYGVTPNKYRIQHHL